ncbi:Glyoxalase superfamily enzyme, possibly 3-demethylubiquinone-9 3-methyltransferase [Prosthecobacter debontii]|uniref:Glyoxalase superfamily enzyme, possibly 3-demethylubiquinone-9 3-methyltransferase n=1 Tax=Prosthecobacter debontii TaxID=48467 RepID=A0A1T4YZY5_9BACT|nr:VOC family protein [Prosthecobacter debontii]SKB06871.1 Glyoxalase superfamily enzyme, possibly 3-demethylubiquinone-9 3-methyltransferase [Prosthecobacter debontii]
MNTTITPCLWFNDQAEEAVAFYLSIFENAKITDTTYYTDAGTEEHGHKADTVMTIAFELNGQTFTALNGGPHFTFNEAISFQIPCDTQEEIDYYWNRLAEGGPAEAQQCGWVKDKYGVSWQVFPKRLVELTLDPDRDKARRVIKAMLAMKKIVLADIEKAAEG